MRNTERGSRNEGSARPPCNGPRLAMSAQIYAVLKPVCLRLERVDNASPRGRPPVRRAVVCVQACPWAAWSPAQPPGSPA